MMKTINSVFSSLNIESNEGMIKRIKYFLGKDLSKDKLIILAEKVKKKDNFTPMWNLINTFFDTWEYLLPKFKIQFATLIFIMKNSSTCKIGNKCKTDANYKYVNEPIIIYRICTSDLLRLGAKCINECNEFRKRYNHYLSSKSS